MATQRATNNAVGLIGFDIWHDYFLALLIPTENSDHPVVSVGSGLAINEHVMAQRIKGLTFVCVDPDPDAFSGKGKQVMIPPKFATVEELLSKAPELKGNVPLVLDWPTPEQPSFDLRAIVDLQPPVILLSCQSDGGAGSPDLLTWLEHVPGMSDYRADGSDFHNIIDEDLEKFGDVPSNYRVLKSTLKTFSMGFGDGTLRYVLLVRNDLDQDCIDRMEAVLVDVPTRLEPHRLALPGRAPGDCHVQ